MIGGYLFFLKGILDSNANDLDWRVLCLFFLLKGILDSNAGGWCLHDAIYAGNKGFVDRNYRSLVNRWLMLLEFLISFVKVTDTLQLESILSVSTHHHLSVYLL